MRARLQGLRTGVMGENDKSEGEHWFHTDKQMEFLDDWIRKSIGGMRK